MEKNKLYKLGILGIIILLLIIYAYPRNDFFKAKKTTLELNGDEFYFSDVTPKKPIKNTGNLNIVFIVLDTVRPDHLSAYGYERETSPNIDELAKEGTLFTNAFTVIPYTTSSHISMMTSLYPFVYQPRMPGAQPTGVAILEDNHLTLAEILRGNGYNTAAFISVSMMSPASGLNDGFEVYNYSQGVRRGNETTKVALEWLEQNYDEKFFLWVHLYDPHDPYNPPEPFDELFQDYELRYDNISLSDFTAMKQAIANYDEDIRFGDSHVGLLLDKIKELGIDNNTLIVFTSDHGEQFGEHLVPIYQGMGPQVVFEHARTLYDQEIKVALIIKSPGIPKNKKVDGLVENIDIMPTILEVLNIPLNKNAQGVSMLPLIKNEEETRSFIFSHLYPIISPYYKSTIRTKDYKLIYDHYNKENQLFDLKKDPQEQINIYTIMSDVAEEYERKMIELIQHYTITTDINIPTLESEAEQQLIALGYNI
ncbi:MAG: sulfatase-like hydrolase/transferase [Nanoarchaeota archaeon]|nr:sulfatase-like hydrolase/transferase [Nanoarchaeota archaeon]